MQCQGRALPNLAPLKSGLFLPTALDSLIVFADVWQCWTSMTCVTWPTRLENRGKNHDLNKEAPVNNQILPEKPHINLRGALKFIALACKNPTYYKLNLASSSHKYRDSSQHYANPEIIGASSINFPSFGSTLIGSIAQFWRSLWGAEESGRWGCSFVPRRRNLLFVCSVH